MRGILRTFLPLYLLTLLEEQPRHGLELARRIGEATEGLWLPSAGTLYPALKRMERDGLIEGAWEPSQGAARRVFTITEAGRLRREAHRLRMLDDLVLARYVIDVHLASLRGGTDAASDAAPPGAEPDPALLDALRRAGLDAEE